MTRQVRTSLGGAVLALVLTVGDVVALGLFLDGVGWKGYWGFLLHVALSVIAGLLTAWHLGKTQPERTCLAILFSGLAIVAPPVGMLGILAYVLVKTFPRPPAATWCIARPTVPDGTRLLAASFMLPSAVELREVLQRRTEESAERRLRAALSTRALASREAIALLRETLSDPNDEVRLFAFSRIDQFRTHLEGQARKLEETLTRVGRGSPPSHRSGPPSSAPHRSGPPSSAPHRSGPPSSAPQRSSPPSSVSQRSGPLSLRSGQPAPKPLTRDVIARLHHELARARCELAYLGLVDGAVRHYTLANAREHATRASELAPDLASSEWLLGRIALTLSDAPRAMGHFSRALELGMSRRKVLPYMAEAAFVARRFPLVRSSLREYAAVSSDPVLLPVVEVWQ